MKDPAKYMLAMKANCEGHACPWGRSNNDHRQDEGHYCSMLAAATTRQHAGAWQACHNISQHNGYVCHCMALMFATAWRLCKHKETVAVTKTRSTGMIGIATTIHA